MMNRIANGGHDNWRLVHLLSILVDVHNSSGVQISVFGRYDRIRSLFLGPILTILALPLAFTGLEDGVSHITATGEVIRLKGAVFYTK